MNFTIQQVSVDVILPLRDQILIQGTNRTNPWFDDDLADSTYHYAVLLQEQVIGCVSLMQSELEGEPAYQLRGMAIAPDHQRLGIGRHLLAHVESKIKNMGIPLLWCNARTSAIPFYEKNGWLVVSDEFDIFGVCKHVKMLKPLELHAEAACHEE